MVPGGFESSHSESEDDFVSPVSGNLRRVPSLEGSLSVVSNVSYQLPERSPTPGGAAPSASGPPRRLLHHGTAVDEIRIAIMKGRLDTVRELYITGIDVNTILNGGWTALMYACSCGQDEIAKFLLDNGADALYHKDQFTALMAACASRRDCEPSLLSCCHSLVEAGSEVNSFEKHLMTPLMFAARENRSTIVEYLLQCGADINAKDTRHWTGLCVAAYAGHSTVVTMLLEAGADPNSLTVKGHTAFDVAELNGKKGVSDVLKKCTTFPPPRSPVPPRLETVNEEPSQESGLRTNAQISNCNNNGWPQSNGNPVKPEPSALTGTQGQSHQGERPLPNVLVDTNTDLYLFLSGLDLTEYLPRFIEQKVDFNTLLLFEEEDLCKIGIAEVGVRKKILHSILDVHKQPWTKDSLHTIKENDLSCCDVQDMISNLTLHVGYMKTSVAFMLAQLRKQPTILEDGVQVSGGVRILLSENATLLDATSSLGKQCDDLQRHLLSFSGINGCQYIEYAPPPNSTSFPSLIALVLASLVGVAYVARRANVF